MDLWKISPLSICLSSLQTTKWRQAVVFCIATTFHSLSRVAARCWAAVYHDVVISNKGIWLWPGELFKIVQAGRTRAFEELFLDFLIYHSATRIIDENSKRLWTLFTIHFGAWVSQSWMPRGWKKRASKLDSVHSAPAMQVPSAWGGSEGKVTHKVDLCHAIASDLCEESSGRSLQTQMVE